MKSKKEWLEELIKYHNNLFWNKNDPIITDPEYDLLVEELRIIDPDNPLIQKIHTIPTTSSKKVEHTFPMLSLDKVYTIPELLNWCGKVARTKDEKFILEPKLDGCSSEYSKKILSTRGDGYIGEDITDKLPIIKTCSVDGSFITDYNDLYYIRGEIVLSISEFELYKDKLLRKSGQPYKTARSACSGLLNKDDVDVSLGRILTLVPFDLILTTFILTELESLDWDTVIKSYKNLDYPTDGIVIKLADLSYSQSLGNTSHHPRGEMAFKFTNPTGKSVLRDIEWSSGKRKLTPVGKIDPVEIGGVIVSNVNLHNYKYILDKNIQINDTLVIERCGDVIPDVQKVIPGKNRIEIKLECCPECGALVIYNEPELYCTNDNCSGKHLQLLLDSVIRIGIERLGEPTLVKLINKGFNDLIKILKLTKEDILTLEGFANISSENMLNEIQKIIKNGVSEWQLLASLNIKDVGQRMSKIILNDMTLSELRNKSISELECINGIGPERSVRIFNGLKENNNYIDELLKLIPIKKDIKMEKPTICFTGKMPEKRSYYESIASEYGYEPVKSATKTLSVLVCVDPNSGSNKLKNAAKNGTEIISVKEFMDRMCIAMGAK